MAATDRPHPLLKAAEIESMPEEARAHPLDPGVVRHTRSLGDAAGLRSLGVHLVRLRPGHVSTVYHFHHQDEEWIYVLSGRGIAEIGEATMEVGPGDFMGFVAGIKAFTAAVLGGIGNIPGAMVGGFFLGEIESVGPILFLEGLGVPSATQLKDVVAFTLLVLVLIFRPQGLLGERLSRARA